MTRHCHTQKRSRARAAVWESYFGVGKCYDVLPLGGELRLTTENGTVIGHNDRCHIRVIYKNYLTMFCTGHLIVARDAGKHATSGDATMR